MQLPTCWPFPLYSRVTSHQCVLQLFGLFNISAAALETREGREALPHFYFSCLFSLCQSSHHKREIEKVAIVQISSLCCLVNLILFFPSSSTHESPLLFLTDLKKTGFCAACPYISFIIHPYQCALVNKKVNLDLPPHKPHRVPSPCLPLSAEPGLCARVPNPWMDTSLLNEPFLLTFLYTLIWRGRSCRR